MASLHRDNQFKLRALSSALLACSLGLAASSAFALQEIGDEDLGDATAEGIAFLPENAAFVFRGAGPNESTATILSSRGNDVGYIRYIPVGPLTSAATSHPLYGSTTGKGDVFLYGLAVSRGDGDLNSRLNATNPLINSWGTAANPWLFKVATDAQVPNFDLTKTCVANDPTCKVTYLALEAPLYDVNVPTGTAAGADAYNLKLAFWADAFVRKPDVVENMTATGTQFDVFSSTRNTPTGTTTRENRLRLQAIWDDFSINGSRIQLFQTLDGAQQTTGMSSVFYNKTLGLAGVLRFNSGDTQADKGGSPNYRATITSTSAVNEYVNDSGTVLPGSGDSTWVNRYSPTAGTAPPPTSAQGTTNCSVPGATAAVVCQYQVRSRTTRISNAYGGTWTTPTGVGVLRFSTRETTDTNVLSTPAINGIAAPTFDANEGLVLYGANINLVLGTLYQPLVLGSDDGKNLTLEVARIPNKAEIYKKIYTPYAGYYGTTTAGEVATYSGSTCNVFKCGATVTLGGTTYQGSTATHSSITIGSIVYDAATNTISAYKGADAIGVSFGVMPTTVNIAPQTFYYYELQNRQRVRGDNNNWRDCTTTSATCGTTSGLLGSGLKFESGGAAWKTGFNTGVSPYTLYNPTVAFTGYTVTDTTSGAAFTVPTVGAGGLPQASWNGTTWVQTTANALSTYNYSAAQVAAQAGTQAGFTNLGSAVIDGFLVQHMKITTKGVQ